MIATLQARVRELESFARELTEGEIVPVVWRKRARAVLEAKELKDA